MNADPLWYKDAIIYQLHVKTFFDGNGDGIGDFTGLTQKLAIVVIANLARSPQAAAIDFPAAMNGSRLEDLIHRELLAPVGAAPYAVTLLPQACRWLRPMS